VVVRSEVSIEGAEPPMKKSREPKSPVDAVQLVYGALEPFDDQARRRIVESAASLLGMRLGDLAHREYFKREAKKWTFSSRAS
jgi:hypothetical protein